MGTHNDTPNAGQCCLGTGRLAGINLHARLRPSAWHHPSVTLETGLLDDRNQVSILTDFSEIRT